MESDELRHLDQLGFDEKTETWFVDTSETSRLALTRSTLEALVQLYNRIHRGNPLHVADQKTLHRMRDGNAGHEGPQRGQQQSIPLQGPTHAARRMSRLIARIVPSLLRRRHP